jgi:hypothetical protein
MKHHSEALSMYKTFSAIICTHFDTSICVFHADSVGEYLFDALRHVLAEQGTLDQFYCPGAHAHNGFPECKRHHLLETTRTLMIASFVPPHFWVEVVSTATYLINNQRSSTLQGGIPFEHLCGMMSDYSNLHLFGCVCYVLLAPHERTKLTVQSIECVFLHLVSTLSWDPIARRMRTSRDVIFDESRPFFPHPSTDASPASLVDPLSFLLFPNAPACLPIPRSNLPSSVFL